MNNRNTISLINHAMLIYNIDCEYKLHSYASCMFIEFLHYDGICICDHNYNTDYVVDNDISVIVLDNNDNIRSFVEHWCIYYNFPYEILYIVTFRCDNGMYNIEIASNNKLYKLVMPDSEVIANSATFYK